MADLMTTPLGQFGVEVDCDLSRPLDPDGEAALRDLLYREKLLVFRGQSLSEARQRAVLELFGDTRQENSGVISLEGDTVGACALAWHGDIMFVPEPYHVLSLYGLDIDEASGTSTRFIDGVAAASRLPAPLRERLAGRTTTAVFPGHVSRRLVSFETPASQPQIHRPVLWPHPVTNQEILFIYELYTTRIDGLPQAESDVLIGELFAHLYGEAHVQEHVWRTGDLVVWDNLALQHGRAEQLSVRRRTMRRMVAGRGPTFFAQCPQVISDDPGFLAWTRGQATVAAAASETARVMEFCLETE
jgi:taurine dioxygenase